MAQQSRVGDIAMPSGGHSAWPPTSITSGASTVFVNGIPAAFVSSGHSVHCLGTSCHAPVQAEGSSTVFIEGNAASRVGDDTDCGMKLGTGSFDVLTG